IDAVGGLLSEAGIGLILVCLFAPFEQLLAAEAWRALFPPGSRPRRMQTLLASWMGSAVNTLLPVATIGGEIAKARILILWKYAGAQTAAATTVDKTIQAIAVLLWGLIGGAFLVFFVGQTGAVIGFLIGAVFLVIGIAGFIAIQLKGGFSLIAEKLAGWVDKEFGQALMQGVGAFEPAIREIYGSLGRLVWATSLRISQRVFLAGEVVLVGFLMGAPVGIVEAVILKGMIGAIRGASFAIPAGIGVQEGGYVAIGALIGYPPDLMIAVSLATRIREILPSIPFLLFWQVTEGRAFWSRPDNKDAKKAVRKVTKEAEPL
ncbi:MAG: lysylphosphatidylglycerol synthase domain-containing protein, partial [Proteobacteria bacterium]|nr:lysylphosphatidylglycerol synthase domain-containing protein [Pseudomonadota bacterium]